jgi:Trk-type K+ transport system membrane component
MAVGYFWTEPAYLTNLYNLDQAHFVAVTLVMTIVAVLKAIMFYLILRLLVERKPDMAQPFKHEFRRFISLLVYLAAGIGLFSYYGYRYSLWLTTLGLEMADLQALHISGADVWLFMAVILFVIGQIVKRGIEIQAENELTI